MSEFTQHTLRRMTRDEHERSISNSFLVSADMARKCSDCERQSNVVLSLQMLSTRITVLFTIVIIDRPC